ncbi:cytoplasmic tRNA 2-thiolation protein 2 isoform 2-T2 [Menidia menidia]
MCQVEEDYQQQLERAHVPSVSKKCVKCKEGRAAVVIRARDAYCRNCFRDSFVHKFRAMLGKTRVIFPGEKVLLAVSGGPSSCSMLSQVQEGLSQNAHKKLRFVPAIVFIDEGGAVGRSEAERRRTVCELQALFRATGFPFHIVPLEQVLELPRSAGAGVGQLEGEGGETPETQTRVLQQLIGSAQTLTAKQELLSNLRQHLLVHMARTLGCSKLMLGENCTRLAVKLLSCISLGRGAQLAQDTGFSDCRYGDVVCVRPMREYSAKEIAFYTHLFRVPTVMVPDLDTQVSEKASIQRLTESFVTKLQTDFPSTVSTIYRTSEKLQTACGGPPAAEGGGRCLLCVCRLDTAAEKASALQATLTSEQLSAAPPAGANATHTGQCCSSSAGTCSSSSDGGCCSSSSSALGVGTNHLRSQLCYSCQLTIRDMSSVSCLPQFILSEAQRRTVMREEISGFLLDGADEEESSPETKDLIQVKV